MKVHRLGANYMTQWALFRTVQGLRVVSDSEVLFMFVTLDGEEHTINISGSYKTIQNWKVRKSK
jgi:hypothetical protein